MNQVKESGHIVVGPQFFEKVLNNLYSSRDVFMRELLWNCQTALRKREMLDPSFGADEEFASEGRIDVVMNLAERWIEISDNGSGISQQEFREVLPRVGESSTEFFRKQHADRNLSEMDRRRLRELVGYFGVGLYSGMLVADAIQVTSRCLDERMAYQWTGYRDTRWELQPVGEREVGTTVRLLNVARPRPGEKDPLDEAYLAEQVRRWADYCPYPIWMASNVINRRLTPWQDTTRPSMNVLKDFYRQRYPDRNRPFLTIPLNMMGGSAQLRGVLYVLDRESTEAPTLLVRRVPVAESIQLVPAWADFVWGVVDCPNLPLRLDREGPKPNAVELEDLKKALSSVLLRKLGELPTEEPETWRDFWELHGEKVVQAALSDELICQRLGRAFMFPSSKRKFSTIHDYVQRSGGKDSAEVDVWFATDQAAQRAHLTRFQMEDTEVLFVPGAGGEFLMRQIEAMELDQKPRLRMRRIDEGDVKSEIFPPAAENLRDLMRHALGDQVAEIQLDRFEPADQPVRLDRVTLPDELRRAGPTLEELARVHEIHGSLDNTEELPASVRQICERAREDGIDLDDLVRKVQRKRLVINWQNQRIQQLAEWAGGVASGIAVEHFRTVAELLLYTAYFGSGVTLGTRVSNDGFSACCKSFTLILGLLEAVGEKPGVPEKGDT